MLIKKRAIEPDKFTASSACLGDGLIDELFVPCASPSLLRRVPNPFTTAEQPPRICLKIFSVCWSADRLSSFERVL